MLAPGDGEEGFGALAAPLSVGICELLPVGSPSDDLMSRGAAGTVLLPLDPGFDLSFLKKKLIVLVGQKLAQRYNAQELRRVVTNQKCRCTIPRVCILPTPATEPVVN